MKRNLLVVIIAILVATLISGCTPEPEVKVKEIKVAVVEESQLWSQSQKAKDYQQQLNDKVEALKAEYNANLEDLSEEEKTAKHQEIYQQINDLREKLKEEFRQDIAKTVKAVAEKEGYDVVLNKDEVRYGGEDITEEVLKELE